MALEKFQHGETDFPNRHVSWHNNRVRAEMAEEELEDWVGIVNALAIIGRWDESEVLQQARQYGENNTYNDDMY